MIVVLPPSCHDHPFRKDEGTRQNVHVFFRVETALALKLGKWKTPSNSTIDDVPIRKNGTFHGLSTAICIGPRFFIGGINGSKPA